MMVENRFFFFCGQSHIYPLTMRWPLCQCPLVRCEICVNTRWWLRSKPTFTKVTAAALWTYLFCMWGNCFPLNSSPKYHLWQMFPICDRLDVNKLSQKCQLLGFQHSCCVKGQVEWSTGLLLARPQNTDYQEALLKSREPGSMMMVVRSMKSLWKCWSCVHFEQQPDFKAKNPDTMRI